MDVFRKVGYFIGSVRDGLQGDKIRKGEFSWEVVVVI